MLPSQEEVQKNGFFEVLTYHFEVNARWSIDKRVPRCRLSSAPFRSSALPLIPPAPVSPYPRLSVSFSLFSGNSLSPRRVGHLSVRTRSLAIFASCTAIDQCAHVCSHAPTCMHAHAHTCACARAQARKLSSHLPSLPPYSSHSILSFPHPATRPLTLSLCPITSPSPRRLPLHPPLLPARLDRLALAASATHLHQ